MNKRIVSIILSFLIIVTCFPLNLVHALPQKEAFVTKSVSTISVESVYAKAGKTVDVDVKISDNCGIAGAQLTITYDAGLTLIGATSGAAFSNLDYTRPSSYSSPCNFNWDSENAMATEDGTILTLTFAVDEDVSANTYLSVNISSVYGDIYDIDTNSLSVNLKNGYIDVIAFIYGDVNNDDTINGKDVTLIRRFNAGYDVNINEAAADVNCDGRINGKDVTLIRRYNAGWDIKLPTVPPSGCNHNMEHHAAVPATCTEDGNIDYWHCTTCGKYFSDANGRFEITQASTVIHATGHSFSDEWSFDSTYHWHASTCEHETAVGDRAEHTFNAEGICTVCGASSNTPDPSKPYRIDFRLVEYNTNQGDSYIATQEIDNSANEEHVFFSASETFELKPISCPGYEFLGWYTPEGVRMTSVPRGTDHDLILYARWREIVYDITYRVYMSPLGNITDERYLHYTVSKGLQDLPNPTINNYKFLGWYNENDAAVTRIPVGTTGDIVLSAYWTSYRNIAKQNTGAEATKITDIDNGYIYFIYPLGTIENVPLSTLWTIQGVTGLGQVISTERTTSLTQARADAIAEMIASTTTDSATWRLSEDWSETEHVDEQWAQSHGVTSEEAETILKGTTNSYSITTSSGGSSSSTHTDGTTTVDYDSQNYEHGRGAKLYAEVSGKYEAGAEANVGIAKAHSKFEIAGKVGGEYTQNQNWNEHTGTDTTTVSTDVSSSSSTWNNSNTSSYTEQASRSQSSSLVIADVLSNTYNVGRSYIHGTSQSNEQGFSSSDSQSINTSSTITTSMTETTVTTKTYTSDGKSDGWYRAVIAGKFHVYGVAGYDVASKSFFTNTFSIMDDETYEFLDYSPESSFDDNENCALQFDVPYELYEYVMQLTVETEGLLFRTNTSDHTATVIGYTGTETDVIVPSFISTGTEADNNMTAYRVTGISSSAFAGKNIRSIILGRYITEIPDNAFKNCTELEQIWGSFTSIGAEAFSGCANLEAFTIPSYVSFVGSNAFAGVPAVNANVLSEEYALYFAKEMNPNITNENQLRTKAKELTETVATQIINCGADSISMNVSAVIPTARLTLNVPDISAFELKGGNKTFTDLRVNSDADSTAIRNIKIKDCTRIPLVISSDSITLDTVNVTAPSFALIAKSQSVDLTIVKDNILKSNSGHAVVCKDPTIISEVSTRATVGVLDITGNMYVCGSAPTTGSEYIDFTSGQIVYINNDQFNSLIRGYFTVTFDPNGGSVSTPSKNVNFGEKYGTLPTPTRSTYDFVGWYTSPTGGTRITADTVSTSLYNQTLYAHWELKQYTVRFNANGGSCGTSSINAVIGTAPSSLPTATRTGFSFAGWFTAASGGTQMTVSNWNSVISGMNPTTLVNNGLTLYAHWNVNSYTVSWSTGTGYSITVKRTSSPNAGASTGNLSSGATVYYGDVLSVTYTPSTGYSIATHGSTSITVTGNVGSSTIYATASTNSYTYNIVYKSVNGTSLGSTTITKPWGSTATVSAPAKTGYNTPASQTVTWNATSKTITFNYTPTSVSTSQQVANGWFWQGNYSTSGIQYSVKAEYRNRTSSNVQVRLVWTQSIKNAAFGYNQYFNSTIGGVSTGNVKIASTTTWPYYGSNGPWHTSSVTVESPWITVSASATSTSLSISTSFWAESTSAGSGSWSATMAIPTY